MANTFTKLRLGIIGAGSVVREIYQFLYFRSRYSGLLDICGVADPNADCRNWFGDLAGLPAARRFASFEELIARVELDAVQVNTPDHLHRAPAVAAMNAGLDVVVPKPAAACVADVQAMLQAARKNQRFLGVDFHKRQDPRIREAGARFESGRYGVFQSAVFYMLDKLLVADPNHTHRFFASPDFVEKNTPISFLTVHMADALMQIIKLKPVQARATGYAHKLPSLKPRAVAGYDLVDTEIVFENGGLAHIITGWALPNTAWSTTVQSGRIIGSEGMIDLGLDTPGLREVHSDGLSELNPLFRNFETGNTVSGYGISNPGHLYEQLLSWRNGTMSEAKRNEALDPMTLGFYTTLVLEAAELSLATGKKLPGGATLGPAVDLQELAVQQLGSEAGLI